VHFLSLAVITVWFVPRDWQTLKSPLLWPAIVCGQHSLETFCLGVFLAFAAHFLFTEVSNSLLSQVIISLTGIVIMVAVAALISWYRGMERQGPGPRPPAMKPGYAGGDA
jgi:RsiW-degrading membrane proteinase PrsW (M82 family)